MGFEPEHLRVFVIGPIGNKYAKPGSDARKAYDEGMEILREVIKPACKEHGLEAFRSDDIHEMGEVDEQVFRLLRDHPTVIADLSGLNANVMCELGARYTTGKLTIPLMATSAERSSDLPFDVHGIRTILFPRTPEGLLDARQLLSKAIEAGLGGRGKPVTLTRVWLESPEARVQPIATVQPVEEPEIVPNPRLALLVRDATLNLQSIRQGMDAGTTIIHEMTALFTSANDRAEQAKASGVLPDVLGMLREIGQKLRDPTEQLEVIAVDLSQTVGRLQNNVEFLLERLDATPGGPSAYPSFAGMVSSLKGLAQQGRRAANQTEEFRKAAEKYLNAPHAGDAFQRLGEVLGHLTSSLRHLGELDAIV